MKIYPNNKAVAHEQARLEIEEARLTLLEHSMWVFRDKVKDARGRVKSQRAALNRAKKLPAPRRET